MMRFIHSDPMMRFMALHDLLLPWAARKRPLMIGVRAGYFMSYIRGGDTKTCLKEAVKWGLQFRSNPRSAHVFIRQVYSDPAMTLAQAAHQVTRVGGIL